MNRISLIIIAIWVLYLIFGIGQKYNRKYSYNITHYFSLAAGISIEIYSREGETMARGKRLVLADQ